MRILFILLMYQFLLSPGTDGITSGNRRRETRGAYAPRDPCESRYFDIRQKCPVRVKTIFPADTKCNPFVAARDVSTSCQ